MERRAAIRKLLMAGAVSIVPRLWGTRPQDQQQEFTIRSEVRLVLLDVSVKDRAGAFVPALSKDNFSVFENDVRQPITVFAREDLPVTVGILVDESQSMGNKRADVLAAAETLIAEGNPQDETFVLHFNEKVRRGLPDGQIFSSDIQQLSTALYRGFPLGRTALYDAVFDGLNQLDLGHRDKKALVLISDGGDNLSTHHRREVLDKLDRSIATVYAVGLYDADDPDRSPGLLKHLAAVSGGEAFFPANPAGMTDVCRGIAKDIRTRYTVGYIPPASHGGPLRRIRVSAAAPSHTKLTVRAHTQYRFDDAVKPGSGNPGSK
jgi:Ca-activated chloride channel homolog